MSAEASTMQAALDWMRAEHGSIEGYVAAHGFTDAELSTLREGLIDDGRDG